MNAEVIPTLLADLLSAVEDAYDQTPNAPEIPATRYITFGPGVYTTDQITVAWSSVYPSAPNGFPQASLSPARNTIVPVVELVIEVARANNPMARPGTPGTVRLPEAEARAQAAALIAADATTVFGYISALCAEGRLFRNAPIVGKGDTALGRLTPIGPNAQFTAFRWPIQAKAAVAP